MNKFKPPEMTGLKDVIKYLQKFAPMVGRELGQIEGAIPKPLTLEEILVTVKEDPEVKDAIYRYIKDREAREE